MFVAAVKVTVSYAELLMMRFFTEEGKPSPVTCAIDPLYDQPAELRRKPENAIRSAAARRRRSAYGGTRDTPPIAGSLTDRLDRPWATSDRRAT